MTASAEVILDTPRPRPSVTRATADELPAWPLVLLLAPMLLWFVLGVIDVVIVPLGAVMALYLLRARGVRVPRGYAIWLVFLLWAALSAMMLNRGINQIIGFGYRYLIYVGATVVFVYVYNARAHITIRKVAGLLTIVWLTTVLGGYLGIAFPYVLLRTPASFVLREMVSLKLMSQTIVGNDLVSHMVVRRFTQGNTASYYSFSPRPSAPFRYTNNWGNVYSILLPVVVGYMVEVRRTRRFWLLLAALPISAVPALLTLNRGMLLGIGLALVYVSLRKTAQGQLRFLVVALVAVAIGLTLYSALGIQQRNDARFFKAGTNQTRSSLYLQSIESVRDSPVFGYGAPRQGDDPNAPNVGTQGQVWLILVSHGPLALATFMGWLLLTIVQTRRRADPLGLALHTSLLVGTAELVVYGVIPYGLPLMMVAAAAAVRPPWRDATSSTPGQPSSVTAPAIAPVNPVGR